MTDVVEAWLASGQYAEIAVTSCFRLRTTTCEECRWFERAFAQLLDDLKQSEF